MMERCTRRSAGSRLITLLPLTIGALSIIHGCEIAKPTSPKPEASGRSFVARVASVQTGMEQAFLARFRECYVPLWQQLHGDGTLSSVYVFELIPTEATLPETPPWHYLLLAELGPRGAPADLLDAERTAACRESIDKSPFTVLRAERMSCTPNSCFAMPKLAYEDAAQGIEYLIEFIGVEDSPSSLERYRELMSDYFGPANGLLLERGLLHSFIALETTEVLSHAPGVPAWNQLHVSDNWDVDDELDWDSIYEDLFRQEFSCELDSIWDKLPPIRERPSEYSGRLVEDLCVM